MLNKQTAGNLVNSTLQILIGGMLLTNGNMGCQVSKFLQNQKYFFPKIDIHIQNWTLE